MAKTNPTDVVTQHVTDFNARNLDDLLDGFAEDAIWRTGHDTVRGRVELRELFAAAMAQLAPTLDVRSMVSEGDQVAAQIVETLVADGVERVYPIAGFYEIDAGKIRSATIYREGSADVL